MRFWIDESLMPATCNIYFYKDGSFGLGPKMTENNIDFEIDLISGGSIALLCSLVEKKCYCVQGYSWDLWKNLKNEKIDITNAKDASLRFELNNADAQEYGLLFDIKLKATSFDRQSNLLLYGSFNSECSLFRFASGQYVYMLNDKITGLIIDISAVAEIL